jgi:hypothetical protein
VFFYNNPLTVCPPQDAEQKIFSHVSATHACGQCATLFPPWPLLPLDTLPPAFWTGFLAHALHRDGPGPGDLAALVTPLVPWWAGGLPAEVGAMLTEAVALALERPLAPPAISRAVVLLGEYRQQHA